MRQWPRGWDCRRIRARMLVKKDKNNGAADVNMSFGSFQLRVKAASYRTPDSPDQVTAFYRKALGRYGDVIQCQNDKPVGTPTSTAEGLTCDNEKKQSCVCQRR